MNLRIKIGINKNYQYPKLLH